MRLYQLMDRLEEIDDHLDGQDPEIRIAYQEAYPLAGSLRGVVLASDVAEDPEEEMPPTVELEEGEQPSPESAEPEIVWLVMGSGGWDFNPYEVPRDVFDAAY